MKKTELVSKIAEKHEMPKYKAEEILDSLKDIILDGLETDPEGKVTIPGVGSFSLKHIGAKEGVIQMGEKKGEIWKKPACDIVAFKASKAFKEAFCEE